MSTAKKPATKAKFGPIEWDQRIKELQAEISTVGSELSEKRTELQQAEGRLKNSEKELEFYTVPPARFEHRVYPRDRKEDQARIEQDVRRGKVAVEFAEKAYRPLQEQHDAMQEELNSLIANPPAVAKVDLKRSFAAVSELEQKLFKIKVARDNAESSDTGPSDAMKAELEQALSAYELAASGVDLGESTPADVDRAEKHLKQVRAKITEAETAAASQKAAVSGYGRRIEAIETELEQARETHRVMVGLFGEALQQEAIERINGSIDNIRADLGEVAQADRLMRRFRAGNSCTSNGVCLELNTRDYTHIHGVNTGRILPDDSAVRNGVEKLLVSIGYPIKPEGDE